VFFYGPLGCGKMLLAKAIAIASDGILGQSPAMARSSHCGVLPSQTVSTASCPTITIAVLPGKEKKLQAQYEVTKS
jgi:hypothetical protein